jgi:hypothetical protein
MMYLICLRWISMTYFIFIENGCSKIWLILHSITLFSLVIILHIYGIHFGEIF